MKKNKKQLEFIRFLFKNSGVSMLLSALTLLIVFYDNNYKLAFLVLIIKNLLTDISLSFNYRLTTSLVSKVMQHSVTNKVTKAIFDSINKK